MIAAVAATLRQFEYVREWDDEFLKLFPHRFDYIYAPHPEPGTKPDWKTQSNHPLSDRLIRQGAYLYGVRFGAQTNYLMLDIDSSSIYHPHRDEFAIHRIQAALEPLGLVCNVACTSSYSEGIHVYFPFTEPQSSWEIALVAATLLENAGFKIAPGLLEIFPNPKGYVAEGNKSLYAAHRLPMQAGSYILNEDGALTISHTSTFVTNWKFAQTRNDINGKQLTQILKQARRKQYRISGNAQKFLNDLNAEIELGWTEPGQTNHLLGRIAMREYIFRHAIDGGKPLAGQTLAAAISQVARSLPGFDQWCNHRNELEQKAAYWVRSVEASPYYHYGHGKKLEIAQLEEPAEPKINWNQQQTDNARQRITAAISDLLNKNALPAQAKARCMALSAYGISATTLYKHKNLWHPNFLLNSTNSHLESPKSLLEEELHPHIPNPANVESPESLPEEELHPVLPNKLVGLEGEGAAPQQPSPSPTNEAGGCGGFSTGRETDSATPNTKSESQLEKAIAAKRDGTIRDVYWSNTHDCNCVVLHNGIIMPVEQFFGEQPQIDAPLEPAPEGIELVRPVIEQIKAKKAALKAEKLAERLRCFDIFPEERHASCHSGKLYSLHRSERAHKEQIAKMQQYLQSGEPLLMSEAMEWAKANPGALPEALFPANSSSGNLAIELPDVATKPNSTKSAPYQSPTADSLDNDSSSAQAAEDELQTKPLPTTSPSVQLKQQSSRQLQPVEILNSAGNWVAGYFTHQCIAVANLTGIEQKFTLFDADGETYSFLGQIRLPRSM